MTEETLAKSREFSKKRKSGHKKGHHGKKKLKKVPVSVEKVKIDPKMRKLFRKRARDYNSDDDGDDGNNHQIDDSSARGDDDTPSSRDNKENFEADDLGADIEVSEDEGNDEDGDLQPGITKFTEGCRAFRTAFKSIIKKSVSNDSLGPVLSAHKKLVAEKLAEEESKRKIKGEAKKEKRIIAEKGHVEPLKYLDTHEKFLIGVATKGVVKLFNAVNKAQNAQKGLNPSRSSDAKAINKRRKEAFFSELGKRTVRAAENVDKVKTNTTDGEPPAWAPLRDNYMLTNPKLKDWDKMQEATGGDDLGHMSEDGSSDGD